MSWLSSIKSVFSPAPEINENDTQQVLQNYQISGVALKERITAIQLQGNVLQLTIKAYKEENLQKVHDELVQQLQPHGIHELNLHVVQQKKQPQVTNAVPQ